MGGQVIDRRLVRLLQLASPTLPVGAYSYSQGLESAVEAGVVSDGDDAQRWIDDMLSLSLCAFEGPILVRLVNAWQTDDRDAVRRWNDLFLAGRETSELRDETAQMGYSLARLLPAVEVSVDLSGFDSIAFPTVYGCVAAHWKIDVESAVLAYFWAWLENQVLAAVKIIPLGQTAGQRLLVKLGERLPAGVADAVARPDAEICNFTPGLALLSSGHETQYSRLFRS